MVKISTDASSETQPAIAAARWIDGERFLTTGTSGHAVVLDADRGQNSAPGPMEMVLRSLCGCSATDLVMILHKARQPFSRVEVSARGLRAALPPRVFTKIELQYRVAGDGLARAAVERAVQLSQNEVLQRLPDAAAFCSDES